MKNEIVKDFTKEDLPKTRFERIRMIFKYRKRTVILLLLLLFPFIAPSLVWHVYSRCYLYNEIPEPAQSFLYAVLRDYPQLFLTFLAGVGLSGAFYVARRMMFSQPLKLTYHFFKGIKQSGFEFGLFMSIYTLFLMIIDIFYSLSFVSYHAGKMNIFILIPLCLLFFAIVFILIASLPFVLSSASLYVVSIPKAFKDGFSSLFASMKKNFFKITLLISPLFLLIPEFTVITIYTSYIGAISLALFYVLFMVFMISSLAYVEFDESINKINYPEFYRAGLYTKEEVKVLETKA